LRINIYYGGRGIIGDPTLYILSKMESVLDELNVNVERYDLFEYKNSITTLPQTLKEADGIILATTVEWYGIGGYLTQFLDACWLYGDKEKISKIYMCPVVMSTTYGERDALKHLSEAWDILGGKPVTGISGYIADVSELELTPGYTRIIDKRTEDLYRSISQKIPTFPSSNQAVKQKVSFTQSLNLTPQEAEQLSELASDDIYVQKQKEDIQELSSMFKDLMNINEPSKDVYLDEFKQHFKPQPGFSAVYKFSIEELDKPLVLKVDHTELEGFYGDVDTQDVAIAMSSGVLDKIISGDSTFQRSFMQGDMKMTGNFKVLRTLDMIFAFNKENIIENN
jgi:putative sterol carrier protein/NAD(P)H-dependent FMN reductase